MKTNALRLIGELDKGDTISGEQIAALSGFNTGTAEHRNFAQSLRTNIQTFTRQPGSGVEPLLLKHEGDGLRVLTDAEASAHRENMRKRRIRGLGRDRRDLQLINVGNLDTEQRKSHDRRLLVATIQHAAVTEATRQIPAMTAHNRKTPAASR